MTVPAPPPKRRGRPPEHRDEHVVLIAARLFAEKGYDATSLRDIAEAAGMTKAALYYWFPEKEKLFERVVAGRMAQLVERTQAAVGEATDPLEKIRRMLISNAREMDENRFSWVASSNTFWSNFNATHRATVVPHRDRFEAMLRGYVQEAVDQKLLRADMDTSVATRLLLSALNYLPRWHKPGGRLTAVQVIEQYLDLILDGMRAR